MPKILLIDRDANVAATIASHLSSLGYEVLRANTGAQGIETALSARPGVILLGLILPDMYGTAVYTQLRMTPGTVHTPVVLLAPEDTWDELRAGLRLSASDYLVSPSDVQELELVLRDALAGGRRRVPRPILRDEGPVSSAGPSQPAPAPPAPGVDAPETALADANPDEAEIDKTELFDLEPAPGASAPASEITTETDMQALAERLRQSEALGGGQADADDLLTEVPPPSEEPEESSTQTQEMPPAPKPPSGSAAPPPAPPQPPASLEREFQEQDAPQGEAKKEDASRKLDAEAAPPSQQVEFAAYYPKEVLRDEWKPLTAYVYKAAFADQIAEDARKQLGEALDEMRRVEEGARHEIQAGALITATPSLAGFQFNPPSLSVGFYEDWHRFDFKLRATEALLNQAINGHLTFTVEGVIVADVPLSIFVGESVSESEPIRAVQRHYQAIFCSYSHDDMSIVERVERAYKALGLDYLRDVCALKSGQHWDDQLLKLIDQADIFQLFWSRAAAASKYVRQEWEYALKLNREASNFIRPVYWQQPLPSVPPELDHIHFTYQPNLSE